jgi:hypothetical protein
MRRSFLIGVATFAISLIVLSYCLSAGSFFDQREWTLAPLQYLQSGTIAPGSWAFGYPAASIILPTAFLITLFKLNSIAAFCVVIVFELSVCMAGLVTLAYLLRPRQLWWITVLVALVADAISFLLLHSTPPSALVGLLLPLIILLLWHIVEYGGSRWSYILIGILSALAILTRFDLSGVVLAAVFLFLLFVDRKAAVSVAAGTVIGIAIDPLWWGEPVVYVQTLIGIIVSHAQALKGNLTLWQLFYSAPLSFIAVALAVGSLALKQTLLPKRFLIWLLVLSIIIFGLLLKSTYHPIWYFLPLIVIWQTLCPFFLLSLFKDRVSQEWAVLGYCLINFIIAFATVPFVVVWA